VNPSFEILTLKSGVKSLRSLEHMETFHPGIGPLEEARILHVDQQRLVERAEALEKFIIWDVGLGAAANAIAGIEALKNSSANVELHSFDRSRAPLAFALEHAETLGYLLPYREELGTLLECGMVEFQGLKWFLHEGDFAQTMHNADLPSPHSIFYDPYSPARNQDMWTLDHFTSLQKRLNPSVPCLWTNYTRSTAVRVSLLMAGFYVGIGCIIGEKDETTVASNSKDLIKIPLHKDWLERVKISNNSAPMRGDSYTMTAILAEDFARLRSHEQFC